MVSRATRQQSHLYFQREAAPVEPWRHLTTSPQLMVDSVVVGKLLTVVVVVAVAIAEVVVQILHLTGKQEVVVVHTQLQLRQVTLFFRAKVTDQLQ